MPVLPLPARQTIHQKLSPIVGDEETQAMLAQFPASPGEEPVTKAVFEATLDKRLGETEKEMLRLHSKTLTVVISALLGGLTLGMGAAAWISAAVGGPTP
jgi:hypothetical protein